MLETLFKNQQIFLVFGENFAFDYELDLLFVTQKDARKWQINDTKETNIYFDSKTAWHCTTFKVNQLVGY